MADTTGVDQYYYIVSVNHTSRNHDYITFWRPNDRGYCYPLSWAGIYSHQQVMANLSYYNQGCASFAVRKEAVDALAESPAPGMIDGDAGPVIRNTGRNWQKLLKAAIQRPPYKPRPEYKGFRRRRTA